MNKLERITEIALHDVAHDKVVLPYTYSKIFNQYAKEYGVDVESDESCFQLASEQMELSNQMVNRTQEHIEVLSDSTSSARDAILQNDHEKLKEISQKLEMLQGEVEKLREQVFVDALTHTKNRKWMNENLFADEKMKKEGSLIFIDLNNFKTINDSFGHAVGDKVLVYVVKYISDSIKKGLPALKATFIRFGGDEFIIYIENPNVVLADQMKAFFDELQLKICKRKMRSISDGKEMEFTVGFSYGMVKVKEGNLFENILEESDKLMYLNKTLIKEKCKQFSI